jgi:hypothetical protein
MKVYERGSLKDKTKYEMRIAFLKQKLTKPRKEERRDKHWRRDKKK